MKFIITIFSLILLISGCAIEPVSVAGANDKQGYTISCDAGIETCHRKSAELCPNGYDIIEHDKKSSTIVPHYGEYPVIVNKESVTITCG